MQREQRPGKAEGCGGHDSPTLAVADALAIVRERARALQQTERVALRSALDRVLATELVAPIDVPGHDNSAMDGYALASASLPAEGWATLTLVGTAWAGRPCEREVSPGECVRIMTGAAIPRGCDMVVMQEQAQRDGERVRVPGPPRPGANIRRAGEDLAAGQPALAAGTRLGPAQLGLIASLGISECDVFRRPRVCFFSTGDELREVGQPLEPGQIHDSNRYTLYGMLRHCGVEATDLGVVADDEQSLRRAFAQAAGADLIVTSGGVSVGDADHVAGVFGEQGRILFGSVALKPGRPVVFGTFGEGLFFGLPGNPVSAMATFYLFVRPALRQLSGERGPEPVPSLLATCRTALSSRRGRLELLRGRLLTVAPGRYEVEPAGAQGSGRLSSMAQADCFIVIAEDQVELPAGSEVLVQPFAGFC
ncbi:MAG: molybdopterin molybdenumtransferase MoeA [Gammaproteobacteria bacterium]|nr:MAG: molybdopterin molybdenumtransferase MoeA [Gammaproteobacteria bacterium]